MNGKCPSIIYYTGKGLYLYRTFTVHLGFFYTFSSNPQSYGPGVGAASATG